MEALAVLSLAANVIQVVDFSATIVEAGTQVYRSGSTVEHRELKTVADSLQGLSRKLAGPAPVNPAVLQKMNR